MAFYKRSEMLGMDAAIGLHREEWRGSPALAGGVAVPMERARCEPLASTSV